MNFEYLSIELLITIAVISTFLQTLVCVKVVTRVLPSSSRLQTGAFLTAFLVFIAGEFAFILTLPKFLSMFAHPNTISMLDFWPILLAVLGIALMFFMAFIMGKTAGSTQK